MPKKIKFESFKYRFLSEADNRNFRNNRFRIEWSEFINSLSFEFKEKKVTISWDKPEKNSMQYDLNEVSFHTRGDTEKAINFQLDNNLNKNNEDVIKSKNDVFFKKVVEEIAKISSFEEKDKNISLYEERLNVERKFHDDWARSEDIEKIDVIAMNTVCTAPEMRFITSELGNIEGKTLLDVGCGLGEASVYFALLGAKVTSCDLSQGMLDATAKLATMNKVKVEKHLASAEDMRLGNETFDIIYAGNLLHHVDIEETLKRIKPHLADNGTLVTWDPLHYNPAINVYRAIATDVRTPDEHPLKWKDIKTFKKIFPNVRTNFFWFTTLIIFVLMMVAQRKNPNKERYWKVVIEESEKWSWLYKPLEFLDKIILKVFPPFKLLCWNIVVISRNK
tara:strand:- start:2812 stop:3987 length:1176 start_codon:yes stop_codon:yes gene_type:complete